MAQQKEKKHPLLDKVVEFIHRLHAKIKFQFTGRKAVVTIEIDLDKPVRSQIQGLEFALRSTLSNDAIDSHLKTV